MPAPCPHCQKPFELVRTEAACLHFHGPVAPTSLKNRIDLKRFFTPVSYPRTLVEGEGDEAF